MLSKYADESLQATVDGTVNDNWSFKARLGCILSTRHASVNVGSIGSHVLELEALWKLEIKLDGCALMLATQGIGDGDIDLWSIERAITRIQLPATCS